MKKKAGHASTCARRKKKIRFRGVPPIDFSRCKAIEKDMGFKPGEKLLVTENAYGCTIKRNVKVIKEYPYFILVQDGNYRDSLNKADIHAGLLIEKRRKRSEQ